MATGRRQATRQPELFPRSKQPVIAIDPNHRLVQVTDELDWTELEELVQSIRMSKLKNQAGRPPRLRALIGALVFRSLRRMTYRETEDQIQHYAPARYLCALTESDWTPDANTIQDFEQLPGEVGVKRLNEHVVKQAVAEKLADPGLRGASRQPFHDGQRKLREFRLFAKGKTKAARVKLMAGMATIVENVQKQLAQGLAHASRQRLRLSRHRKLAWANVQKLHRTMTALLPQIRYWIRTGWVAANKIVSLQIPEAYAIVRGKVGKAVEFGLNWGIAPPGRWVSVGDGGEGQTRASGLEVRCAGGEGSHRDVWKGSKGLRLRPRRLEPRQRGGAEKAGRHRCWLGPPWSVRRRSTSSSDGAPAARPVWSGSLSRPSR